MPKARPETIVSDDGYLKTVDAETAAGGGTKETTTVRYSVPSTPQAFQKMVADALDEKDGGAFIQSLLGSDVKDEGETPLAWMHRMFSSAVEKSAKQRAYEAVAARSTFITLGKERINIMERFTPAQLVEGINGMRADRARRLLLGADEATVERSIGFGPWRTAGEMLCEQGKAREGSDGKLELVSA